MKAKISMILLFLKNLNTPLVLTIFLMGLNLNSKADSLAVGEPFPSFTDFQLEGPLPTNLKGKIVLVDFWASWCGPCKKSFPVLEKLHHDYKNKGVIIIAVNEDKNGRLMSKFLSKNPSSFSILRDLKHQLISKVGVKSMPSSFILDGSGEVKFAHKGYHGKKTEQQYRNQLNELLSTK